MELSEVQGTVSQEHWSTSSLKGLWGSQELLSSMSTLQRVIYSWCLISIQEVKVIWVFTHQLSSVEMPQERHSLGKHCTLNCGYFKAIAYWHQIICFASEESSSLMGLLWLRCHLMVKSK